MRICKTNSLGKKNGIYKSYLKNGQVKEEVNYINDKREGIYKTYYKNSKLYEEVNYIDDIQVDNIN